jgi:hypothetical protein
MTSNRWDEKSKPFLCGWDRPQHTKEGFTSLPPPHPHSPPHTHKRQKLIDQLKLETQKNNFEETKKRNKKQDR